MLKSGVAPSGVHTAANPADDEPIKFKLRRTRPAATDSDPSHDGESTEASHDAFVTEMRESLAQIHEGRRAGDAGECGGGRG